MSTGVVDGGFRLVPLAVLVADIIFLSEVWNSTCWQFGGFPGGGAYGAMIFAMIEFGRVYVLPVKIVIGLDMGNCLGSVPNFSDWVTLQHDLNMREFEVVLVIWYDMYTMKCA